MKKILLKIFIWFFWKHFCHVLKSVLGHDSLASSIREMNSIESMVRLENNLKHDEKITWDNSKVTDREIFAKYTTLKYFNQIGRLLAFFISVEKKRILA